MIVVDASAVCAMVFGEVDRPTFVDALRRVPEGAVISPVNRWEAAVTIARRRAGQDPEQTLQDLFRRTGISVAEIGAVEADLAFGAWRNFGKGRHPAQLNLGDCFAYALAKSRGLPLLYKGDDFAKTDVRSAL